MPKRSERQLLLDDLEETIKFTVMEEVLRDDSSSNDSDIFERPYGLANMLHLAVNQQRFLKPRHLLDRSRDYLYNYFLNQPDQEFRKITRVSRETFNSILELIEGDEVFQNQSINQQAPLHWQLACALDRLGNDGQGVSHARSKLIWGIGQGTVHLYTRRVVRVVHLCNLHQDFNCWPSAAERQRTSRRMAAKGFKGAVGFVDGTTIPLHKKPAVGGNVFMDRKKRYSVNAQIICDDHYRIIYFKTGHPGSAGDSRVFNSTQVAQQPELAFSPSQYLLADSAYAATLYLVPPYNQRDNRADRLEPRKIERFNTYLAKARVVNEHTIGILKSRWTSLRGMRIDIHEKDDMKNFVHQAVACVVLHNICLSRDPWDEEDSDEEEVKEEGNEGQEQGLQRRVLTIGQRKRMQVRNACLAFHDQA